MKIKKMAHCCLLVEIGGKRIVTDPGNFSTEQNMLTGIDAIVITHEHGDHFHAESVQAIVKNNPSAVVIANSAVGKLLDGLSVAHTVVDGGGKATIGTGDGALTVEGFDWKHEEIFEEMGQVQNTGYLVSAASGTGAASGAADAGKNFFIPGDAYCVPGKPVDVLALPIAGPWCRLPDALRYAIKVKPRAAFPIHDAMVVPATRGFVYQLTTNILKEKAGIAFTGMADGVEAEF
jgi:L-ascorbate metabolism protein UlaG (beta-lactamase superfamily)